MIHFEGKMKQTKQNKKYFIPNTNYTFSQFRGYKKVVHLQVQVRLLLTSKGEHDSGLSTTSKC